MTDKRTEEVSPTLMIAGVNTDVEHDGDVYHVQTQLLRGKERLLESLVFQGGTVLTRLTWACDDLVDPDAPSPVALRRAVEAQHWNLVRKVKHGLLEDEPPSFRAERGKAVRAVLDTLEHSVDGVAPASSRWSRCAVALRASRRKRYALVLAVPRRRYAVILVVPWWRGGGFRAWRARHVEVRSTSETPCLEKEMVRHFLEHTMPELVKQIEALNRNLELVARRREAGNGDQRNNT